MPPTRCATRGDACTAFRGFESEIAAVPIDEAGLDVGALERRLAGGLRPKLLYTIPDHQNPAGVTLAADRRAVLVELARRHNFLIVEDVAYRELAFDDDASPSTLWSLAPDVVVQAGTTSKTFFPGLRLGWVVAPAEISQRLVAAKQNTDQCAGAPVLGAVHPLDVPAFLAAVEHARRGERAVRLTLRASAGPQAWAEIAAVLATLSPGGRITSAVLAEEIERLKAGWSAPKVDSDYEAVLAGVLSEKAREALICLIRRNWLS